MSQRVLSKREIEDASGKTIVYCSDGMRRVFYNNVPGRIDWIMNGYVVWKGTRVEGYCKISADDPHLRIFSRDGIDDIEEHLFQPDRNWPMDVSKEKSSPPTAMRKAPRKTGRKVYQDK